MASHIQSTAPKELKGFAKPSQQSQKDFQRRRRARLDPTYGAYIYKIRNDALLAPLRLDDQLAPKAPVVRGPRPTQEGTSSSILLPPCTATLTPPASGACPLLSRLPVEIRNEIYSHVFEGAFVLDQGWKLGDYEDFLQKEPQLPIMYRIAAPTFPGQSTARVWPVNRRIHSSLMFACKQIHEEFACHVYNSSAFAVSDPNRAKTLLLGSQHGAGRTMAPIPTPNPSWLRTVHLRIDAHDRAVNGAELVPRSYYYQSWKGTAVLLAQSLDKLHALHIELVAPRRERFRSLRLDPKQDWVKAVLPFSSSASLQIVSVRLKNVNLHPRIIVTFEKLLEDIILQAKHPTEAYQTLVTARDAQMLTHVQSDQHSRDLEADWDRVLSWNEIRARKTREVKDLEKVIKMSLSDNQSVAGNGGCQQAPVSSPSACPTCGAPSDLGTVSSSMEEPFKPERSGSRAKTERAPASQVCSTPPFAAPALGLQKSLASTTNVPKLTEPSSSTGRAGPRQRPRQVTQAESNVRPNNDWELQSCDDLCDLTSAVRIPRRPRSVATARTIVSQALPQVSLTKRYFMTTEEIERRRALGHADPPQSDRSMPAVMPAFARIPTGKSEPELATQQAPSSSGTPSQRSLSLSSDSSGPATPPQIPRRPTGRPSFGKSQSHGLTPPFVSFPDMHRKSQPYVPPRPCNSRSSPRPPTSATTPTPHAPQITPCNIAPAVQQPPAAPLRGPAVLDMRRGAQRRTQSRPHNIGQPPAYATTPARYPSQGIGSSIIPAVQQPRAEPLGGPPVLDMRRGAQRQSRYRQHSACVGMPVTPP